ncbi:MAG: hypothetical protein U0797_27940 [Gemmataceae bacterium]
MKLFVFAKRKAGEPATIEQWDTRRSPAPTPRLAFAAVEEIDEFAALVAGRSGWGSATGMSVLGDGAE